MVNFEIPVIFLLGQTTTGKSEMAVNLAKIFDAWIIGCDSRQIYQGLDIGTGKIEGKWLKENYQTQAIYYYKDIPHFLIDYVDPIQNYQPTEYLSDFQSLLKIIDNSKPFDLVKPKCLIVTGGTNFWAKVISGNQQILGIKEEFESEYSKLKTTLQKLSLFNLTEIYQKLPKNELNTLNPSDILNPYRLQNWILKYESKRLQWVKNSSKNEKAFYFQPLLLAIKSPTDLHTKIQERILSRFEQGLIDEVKKFLYLGQPRLFQLGLEYRLVYLYLQGYCTLKELIKKLIVENQNLAKRQLTYLKKWEKITWVENQSEAVVAIRKTFLF